MKKSLILIPLLLFTISCEKLFFHPERTLFYHPETCSADPVNLIVETDENKVLHGWYFKSPHKQEKGTIFFLHGNASNISTESVGMLWLLKEGYNILTFDYRGYGASEGKPNIKGVLHDGLEFLDGFMKSNKYSKKNLIIYGQSLGGAVAAHIARYSPYTDKIKVLILDSTFTSWRSIAKEVASRNFLTWIWQYPVSWSMPKDLSTIDNLKNSKINNTIIIHSTQDQLINFKNGEALFNAAIGYKTLLQDDISKHGQIISNPRIRKELLIELNKIIKK